MYLKIWSEEESDAEKHIFPTLQMIP